MIYESSKCSHRKISGVLDGPIGRCQQTSNANITSTTKSKWLTENPRIGDIHVDMDKYGVEAGKQKIIEENGHLPGSYDYRPYLTIEQGDDYDQTKDNYYKQLVVGKR